MRYVLFYNNSEIKKKSGVYNQLTTEEFSKFLMSLIPGTVRQPTYSISSTVLPVITFLYKTLLHVLVNTQQLISLFIYFCNSKSQPFFRKLQPVVTHHTVLCSDIVNFVHKCYFNNALSWFFTYFKQYGISTSNLV